MMMMMMMMMIMMMMIDDDDDDDDESPSGTQTRVTAGTLHPLLPCSQEAIGFTLQIIIVETCTDHLIEGCVEGSLSVVVRLPNLQFSHIIDNLRNHLSQAANCSQ